MQRTVVVKHTRCQNILAQTPLTAEEQDKYLPEEIDVDGSEAVEKHGMLILHLPKLDRNRQAKLRVKGN